MSAAAAAAAPDARTPDEAADTRADCARVAVAVALGWEHLRILMDPSTCVAQPRAVCFERPQL